MMADYSDFFTNIVAKHLHKLVDLVSDSKSHKVLIHIWVLGIEKNWRKYVTKSDNSSEFISRLSFWIGGLRDEFNSNPSKSKVVDLLYQTFDASTFCYFEYGARKDIERQIENYCKEVDEWFGEDILAPKLKRFRFSKYAIPLISSTLKKLKHYGSIKDKSNIEVSKNIQDASGLEKEFLFIFKEITTEFIKIMDGNIDSFLEIYEKLNSFLSDCQKLGYKNILSKEQEAKIATTKERLQLKNLIINSYNIIKEIVIIDTNKIMGLLDKNDSINKLKQEVISKLSSQLISTLKDDPSKFDKLEKGLYSVNELWVENSIDLLGPKSLSEIENIKSLIHEREDLKEIIESSFNKLEEFEPELPEPSKHKPLVDTIGPKLKDINKENILKYLYSIHIDILKKNPMKGNEIIATIDEFINNSSKKFSVNYLKSEFNKIKDKSYLKIRITNLFRIPKKEIEVFVYDNDKKIDKNLTDENGEIIFENIPKKDIIIKVNLKNKEKEYTLSAKDYYNEKTIWLFSF